MAFEVPTRHNTKLRQLVERINADEELQQLWQQYEDTYRTKPVEIDIR